MSSTSEYFSTSSTKRTSALKLRPSVLTSPAHVMTPSNLSIPWTPCDMPWTMQSNSSGVVEFRGQTNNTLLCKRKAEEEQLLVKPKKLVTEEQMAEHLSSLHISPDFTTHATPTAPNSDVYIAPTSDVYTAPTPDVYTAPPLDYSGDSIMESDPGASASTSTNCLFSPIPTMTPKQDLERKLRNAQRITICEQIRKLQNEPAIPHAILSRFERPCTALVLWQPPAKISELCANLTKQLTKKSNDEEQDNNNSPAVGTTSMELDLDL